MLENFKFILASIFGVLLLPKLYFDGKKIRRTVPVLPDAEDPHGIAKSSEVGKLQVVIIGESTMSGVGVKNHTEGFAGAFANELSDLYNSNIHWNVYARGGYTLQKMTDRLLPKIKDSVIDIIVVGAGGNEAFNLNSPWKWKKEIDRFIKELRFKFPHVPIVFTNLPPIKEFPAFTKTIKFTLGNLVELLGESLAKQVKKHNNVFYINEVIRLDQWINHEEEVLDASNFFSDGVHPSQLTYQLWGRETARFIKKKAILIG